MTIKRILQLGKLGLIDYEFLKELKEIFPTVDFKEKQRNRNEYYVFDIQVDVTLDILEKLTRNYWILMCDEFISFEN